MEKKRKRQPPVKTFPGVAARTGIPCISVVKRQKAKSMEKRAGCSFFPCFAKKIFLGAVFRYMGCAPFWFRSDAITVLSGFLYAQPCEEVVCR